MSNKRDPATGRWLPGHSGNPQGTSISKWRKRLQDHYLQLLEGRLDDETWLAICDRAISDAIDGQNPSPARKWLAAYVLPSPSVLDSLRIERQDVRLVVIYGQPTASEPAFEVIDHE